MLDLNLKLHICIHNIVMEGTVSHISFIDASSFFFFFYEILKKKKIENVLKSCPFFDIKQKLRHKSKL